MSKANELLEKFKVGFEWDMENKPEIIDKADYEFYDEVKEYLESIAPLRRMNRIKEQYTCKFCGKKYKSWAWKARHEYKKSCIV